MYFIESELDKCTVSKGDLLVCEGGDFGRAAIWDFNFNMRIQNHIHKLRPFGILFIKFFYYLFYFYKNSGLIGGRGIGIQGLSSNALHSLLFPLPPLPEQERIVTKFEELLPHIDEYNNKSSELNGLNDSFPEQLKKSILQEAVQGKLVPQDPSDEPASVLLERIREEKARLVKEGKIKKDKNESVIFRRDNSYYEKSNGVERCIDEEIPFEIPDSWEWVRSKNIVNIVSARRVHQSDWKFQGVPFYRAREIGKLSDNNYVDNELFISEELYAEYSKSGVPQEGDLMITAVGTLGKVYIVKKNERFYYKDASVICFENYGKLNPEYLKVVIQSPFFIELIKKKSAGTTVNTLTISNANEYLIPLPPLSEQKRIVQKLEKLSLVYNNL